MHALSAICLVTNSRKCIGFKSLQVAPHSYVGINYNFEEVVLKVVNNIKKQVLHTNNHPILHTFSKNGQDFQATVTTKGNLLYC